MEQIGNYIPTDDWNFEDGYQRSDVIYPFRLYGGKYVTDFEFTINVNPEDIENICEEAPTTLVDLFICI